MSETNGEFLERIAHSTKSSTTDSRIMEYLLKRLGFTNARCVSGIAYLEGQGTLHAPPMSIHDAAKQILGLVNKHKKE